MGQTGAKYSVSDNVDYTLRIEDSELLSDYGFEAVRQNVLQPLRTCPRGLHRDGSVFCALSSIVLCTVAKAASKYQNGL